MLQTLSAGKQLDILTKEDVRTLMQEWKVDVARGARPVSISAQGLTDVNGLGVVGGSTTLTGGTLGPAPGFWWAVVRLAVRIDSAPAAFELYTDRRSPQQLIRDVDGSQNGYVSFGAQELMLGNGSALVVAAGSTGGANQPVYVAGAALEMPEQLLWKWLAG